MRFVAGVFTCGILLALAACSSDEEKPPVGGGVAAFGGGGGSGGTGGSGTTGGSAGDGGTAGSSTGGTDQEGGLPDGDTDGEAQDGDLVDSPEDSVPDIVIPVDPCAEPQSAIGTKGLEPVGDTPPDFAAAYSAEVLAMTEPGPVLLVFDGLDVEDAAAKAWELRIGAMQDAGGGNVTFGETPASLPYRLGEMHTIAVEEADVSFSLRFGAVDIPVVKMKMGGQFDADCANFGVEDLTVIIPDTAAGIAFHGSTVGALLGPPNASYGSGQDNAWVVSLSGQVETVQFQ